MGARRFIAIHRETFDLADEPLEEPAARLLAESRQRGLDAERVWIPKLAETRAW